jgi:MYXO-CTERM domain-containing protein
MASCAHGPEPMAAAAAAAAAAAVAARPKRKDLMPDELPYYAPQERRAEEPLLCKMQRSAGVLNVGDVRAALTGERGAQDP